MDNHLPLSGELESLGFAELLARMYQRGVSGNLTIKSGKGSQNLRIQNNRIVHVSSSLEEHSFRKHLLDKKIIDEAKAAEADREMSKKGIRFGRALMELAYLDPDTLWREIKNQMRNELRYLFELEKSTYQLDTALGELDEPIRLDAGILPALVDGVRHIQKKDQLYQKLKRIDNVYLFRSEGLAKIECKPYELHILEIVRRHSELKEIIKRSELVKFETLRTVWMFLLLDVLSPTEIDSIFSLKKIDPERAEEIKSEWDGIPNISTFASYEEALEHFNLKYELVYRMMSKEIGPIALSILSKSIEDIGEKMPFSLKKATLTPEGRLNQDPILKTVWYYDFSEHIGPFLKGLEEILYAEIYAVKKHLGIEYEQQVLKWIT